MKWLTAVVAAIALRFRSLGWVRRRILLILLVPLVVWVAVIVIGYFTWAWISGQHADEMFRGIFAAVIGELIFFTIVGVVIAILTIRDPTQEQFDDRLKILFGESPIPDAVAVYNKSVLARLAGYVELAERTITVRRYLPEIESYQVTTRTVYKMKNLMPDVEYNDTMKIKITPDAIADKQLDLGRVMSIRVDGSETITNSIPFHADGFSTNFDVQISAGGTKEISFEYEALLKVGEIQSMRPQRVVEQFNMEIVSECDHSPRLEIGDPLGVISLVYRQPYRFRGARGVSPGETVFIFKMLSPINFTKADSPKDPTQQKQVN